MLDNLILRWSVLVSSTAQGFQLSKQKSSIPGHLLFSNLPSVLQFGSAYSPRAHKQDWNNWKGKKSQSQPSLYKCVVQRFVLSSPLFRIVQKSTSSWLSPFVVQIQNDVSWCGWILRFQADKYIHTQTHCWSAEIFYISDPENSK